VRVFAFDEARFGCKTWFRRRWCPLGVRPPWIVHERYERLWLCAAVEPSSGESVCLYLPQRDGAGLTLFLKTLKHAYPQDALIVVLDQAGGHVGDTVGWPEGITPLPLPPYSPELNPAERWFEPLRGTLANTVFEDIDALETALTAALRPYWQDPAKLARLTAYPWWQKGVADIQTLE
jgi:transposase